MTQVEEREGAATTTSGHRQAPRRPSPPATEVLIPEARRRQRRRWAWGGFALLVVVAIVSTSLGTAGGAPRGPSSGVRAANAGPGATVADWTVGASFASSTFALSGVSCELVNDNPCEVVGAATSTTGAIFRTVGDTSPYVAQHVPSGVGPLTAVSCVVASDTVRHVSSRCVAVGRSTASRLIALVTTDNGLHWAVHPLPSATSSLTAVSCSTATACVAVGSTAGGQGLVLSTANGGVSWSTPAIPAGTGALTALSCDQGPCVAAGTSTTGRILLLRRTTPTSPWGALAVPGRTGRLLAVGCATTTYCFAAGYRTDAGVHRPLLIVSSNGRTWAIRLLPEPVGEVTGLQCQPPSTDRFRFGHHPAMTFAPCTVFGERPLGAGTVAFSLRTSRLGIKPWALSPLPAGTSAVAYLGCEFDLGNCVAVSSNALTGSPVILSAITFPGMSPEGPPAAVTSTEMASCGGPSSCMVIGRLGTSPTYEALVTTDGGATWATRPLPTVGGFGTGAISCVTGDQCVVVEHRGGHDHTLVALFTSNAGVTWSVSTLPLYNEPLHAVACPTRSTCVALGNGYKVRSARIALSTDGGRAWHVVVDLPMTRKVTAGFTGVTCPTSQRCVVVGTEIRRTTGGGGRRALVFVTDDGGRRWHEVTPTGLGNDTYPTAVDCPTASRCVLFDAEALYEVSTDGGVRWSARALPHGVGFPYAMSCATATTCLALADDRSAACVDDGRCSPGSTSGAVLTSSDGGLSFSVAPVPPEAWSLGDVACTRGGTCLSVGTNVATGGLILTAS